jgi:hypothetical protein
MLPVWLLRLRLRLRMRLRLRLRLRLLLRLLLLHSYDSYEIQIRAAVCLTVTRSVGWNNPYGLSPAVFGDPYRDVPDGRAPLQRLAASAAAEPQPQQHRSRRACIVQSGVLSSRTCTTCQWCH